MFRVLYFLKSFVFSLLMLLVRVVVVVVFGVECL